MIERALNLVPSPGEAQDDKPGFDHEIEAQTSLVERSLRNLKHGDAFAVLDSYGDIGTIKDTPEGLFYRDTRYLSHLELRLDGKRPLLLSSVIHEDKAALSVDLTNPDVELDGSGKLARDTIFLERTKFLWQGVCYERLGIRNYDRRRRRLRIDFLFGSDFRDLFEVRGMERERRGACSAHVVRADRTEFRYLGLDKVSRRTVLQFQPTPARLDAHRATFEIELAPQEKTSLFVTVACEEEQTVEPGDFFLVYRETRRARRTSTLGVATVSSSNEVFNEVVCRAHVRPLHTDHAHRARAISLRRDSLVQHGLRPRRHHYGHVDAVDGPVRGARRAALACRHPSDGYSPGGGCAAGQDPARAPSRRDGAPRRGAVPVLLRNGGRDAALRHARRHVFRTHR